MPSYATIAQLKARYDSDTTVAHLTDTEASGVPDDTLLTAALDYAEGYMNSRFSRRYVVPIDVTVDSAMAAFLTEMTLDIAMKELSLRQNWVSKGVQDSFDSAKEWLDSVAKGELDVPTAVLLTSTTHDGTEVRWGVGDETGITESKRAFTRESMKAI